MTSRQDFAPKKLGETIAVVFEFVSELAPGETITSSSVTVAVWSGTDASPSSMLSGAVSISGTKVTQLITGGVLGVVYFLTCQVSISSGPILQQTGYLAVITNVP